MPKTKMDSKKNLLEEKVVSIGRVTKVTKGGRHFRFAATVVVNRTVKAIIHFFIIVYFKCYYSLLFFHIAKKQQKKESYKGFSLLREGISLFIILC